VGLDVDPMDIRVDVFRGGVGTPVHVRVVHLPTGRVATATDLSQIRARDRALAALRSDDWVVDFLRIGPDGNIKQRPLGGWPLDV
jgi:protein subunit release factor A